MSRPVICSPMHHQIPAINKTLYSYIKALPTLVTHIARNVNITTIIFKYTTTHYWLYSANSAHIFNMGGLPGDVSEEPVMYEK